MNLRRPSRSAQGEPTTALIDVVFFLLVFFMLIGRMDATAPFDVAPPTADTGQDLPAGGATLSISADGHLALGGREVDPRNINDLLAEGLRSDPGLRLRINAHQDAELRNVLPLISQAEALGIEDIVLIVSPDAAPVP